MSSTWMISAGTRGDEPDYDALSAEAAVVPLRAILPGGEELEIENRAVVRIDREEFLRTVSASYQLVTHRTFFRDVHAAVAARHRVRWVDTLVGEDGNVARVAWTLHQRIAAGGEEASPRIVATNGYAVRMRTGITPAAVVLSDETEVRVPWWLDWLGEIPTRDDVDEAAGFALADAFEKCPIVWAEYADIRLSPASLIAFLDATELAKTHRREIVDRFVEDEVWTLWGGYRGICRYATKVGRDWDPDAILRRREALYLLAHKLVKGVLEA